MATRNEHRAAALDNLEGAEHSRFGSNARADYLAFAQIHALLAFTAELTPTPESDAPALTEPAPVKPAAKRAPKAKPAAEAEEVAA